MSDKPIQTEDYQRNPFPQPRTYPQRWDLSGLYGDKKRTRSNGNPPLERMETFPKTMTIPGKWDVSSING